MSTIITRLYKSEATAKKVVGALRAKGLKDEDISVFAGATDGGDLRAAGIDAAAADGLAARVGEGGALVVVRAPFGAAVKAQGAVDTQSSLKIDSDVAYRYSGARVGGSRSESVIPGRKYYLSDPDDPPLAKSRYQISDMMGWKLLSDRKPSPDILMESGKRIMPWEPLSTWQLGTKLSDKATPFSDALNWPTLKEPNRSDNLMRNNPTPFSTRMGWRLLSD